MKRSIWIGVVILVVAGLGVFGFAHKTKAPTAAAAVTTAQSTTVSYQGQTGKNAMELLKTNATVETTTDPNLGEYATSINGVKNGTDSKYWIMYVNGEMSSVGASTYVTTSNDTIEWKLQ